MAIFVLIFLCLVNLRFEDCVQLRLFVHFGYIYTPALRMYRVYNFLDFNFKDCVFPIINVSIDLHCLIDFTF